MFSLFRKAYCYIKRQKSFFTIYFHDLSHGNTEGYRGLQGVTRGDRRLQRVTRGYRGLQGVTGCYKTMDYPLWKNVNFVGFWNRGFRCSERLVYYIKHQKSFSHYFFGRFMTWEYRGLQGVTGGYKGL